MIEKGSVRDEGARVINQFGVERAVNDRQGNRNNG